MKTSDFDYDLPEELIALHPPGNRDGGRLLVLDPVSEENRHRLVRDLAEEIPGNALLVANDTRVIKARLVGRRPTGGKVEVLLVRPVLDGEGYRFEVLLQSNRRVNPGDRIDVAKMGFTVLSRGPCGAAVIGADVSWEKLMGHVREHGEVPLPPYIRRPVEPEDEERYQTVFASKDGSVAAPTAGLHFTPSLMDEIRRRGVEMAFITLHVGPGTFRPIFADDVAKHEMDKEAYDIGEEAVLAINRAKADRRPVIAVGTTTTRALEGAFAREGRLGAGSGFTDLFITPGFGFNVVDGLITNFHLPRSTLLLLVSALAGRERVLRAYEEAIHMKYRFYSYGDAMLILPGTP